MNVTEWQAMMAAAEASATRTTVTLTFLNEHGHRVVTDELALVGETWVNLGTSDNGTIEQVLSDTIADFALPGDVLATASAKITVDGVPSWAVASSVRGGEVVAEVQPAVTEGDGR